MRQSRDARFAGLLALTMLMGASLACNRDARQNNTQPTDNPPAAVQAPATQPPQATTAPSVQPSSEPATQAPPATTQPTEAPTLAQPTAAEGTSETDAIGAQIDDLLNQLDAANNSADDLSDANP